MPMITKDGIPMALSVDKSALRKYIERSLQDLPALPPIVAKILELTERPDSTATELDKLISSDPAMSSKVLRVVNSAYYGLSNQVGTTAHAIVILGFRQIQNLVLSMAAMSLVKSRGNGMAKHQMKFWRHSYGAAAASSIIADLKSVSAVDRDQAVIGALLHDIGVLFLHSSFTDLYAEVIRFAEEKQVTLDEAEYQLLGITHADVGEILTSAWHFPEYLRILIRDHQGPFAEQPCPAVCLVHAGDMYTRQAGYCAVDVLDVALNPHVVEWLSLSPEKEIQLIQHIQEKVRGAEDFFGLI